MARIFISPNRYIQGAGEMKKVGEYTANLGSKALVLVSQGGKKRSGAEIEASFKASKASCQFEICGLPSSRPEAPGPLRL